MYRRIIPLLILFLLIFSKCKKDNNLDHPLNVTLYDKQPAVIYSYIKGKWEFVYGKGGFIANTIHYCDGCTVEFTPEGKIITNTFIEANAVIEWQKEESVFNGEPGYVMHFQEQPNAPVFYVIDGIFNDTLKMHPFNVSEPIFSYFVRK